MCDGSLNLYPQLQGYDMTQILFVCSANRYRSVIAAACFRDEAMKRDQGDRWTILSAGTWTTDGLPPMTEAILGAKQIGLDIQKHRSRAITKEMLQSADLVLVMEKGQQEALQIEFPFLPQKNHVTFRGSRRKAI